MSNGPCTGSMLLLALAGVTACSSAGEPARSQESRSQSVPERKALLVVYDPALSDGSSLRAVEGWSDPNDLVQRILDDLATASHGEAKFSIANKPVVVTDHLPSLTQGTRWGANAFTADQLREVYDSCGPGAPTPKPDWCDAETHHSADTPALLAEFSVAAGIDAGDYDEVWVYAPPFAGFPESQMFGPNAYWLNAPAGGDVGAHRRFAVMGWNYERDAASAMHSFGHRSEFVLDHVYGGRQGSSLWARFATYHIENAGHGGVGEVHHPVNTRAQTTDGAQLSCDPIAGGIAHEYDWDSPCTSSSDADAWAQSPLYDPDSQPSMRRDVSCSEWGCSEDGFLMWWYAHMPHGQPQAPNWWAHILLLDDGPPDADPPGAPVCAPQCDGKNCGDDGCAGSCGACAPDQSCSAGVCAASSTGDDGGSDAATCTTDADCAPGSTCVGGVCTSQ